MKTKSIHRVLARNSLANILRYAVSFVVLFFLTPYIITSVGDSQYGLWALTFSFVGYAGLLDMGIQLATIKLVAEYNSKKDIDHLSSLCSTVLCFFTVVGILASAGCWFVLPFLMPGFIADPATLSVAGPFLVIIGIDVLFVFVGNVLVGIGLGLQQYHVRGFIDMVCVLLKLIGSIVVLRADMGLVGLAWVKLGLDILSAVVMLYVCYKTVPGLKLNVSRVKKSSFLEVFGFGGKLFVSSTMTRINQNTIPIVISAFLSTTWLAYYSAASRVSGYAQDMVYSITASFLPMFSELLGVDDKDRVKQLYLQYTRYILLLTLPGYIFLIIAGPSILSVWISPRYGEFGGGVMQILACSALVSGLQPLAGRSIVGGGRLNGYVVSQVCTNVLAIVASIVLIPIVGVSGAGLGILISNFVSVVCVTLIVYKYPGVSVRSYILVLLKVLPPAGVFGLALWLSGAGSSDVGLGGIMLRGGVAYGLYAGVACVALSVGEREAVFERIKRIFKANRTSEPRESGVTKGGQK